MDLFDYIREQNKGESPLARRLRPFYLEDVVGQEHILAKDKLLYRAIKADRVSSIILYGPPGTGKTTIAHVIANSTSAVFKEINATKSGKKDMEEVVEAAKKEMAFSGKKTILFVDEIHRFNKAQQDFLLPYVEDGTVTLIGATTENPYFEVNKALVSRSAIFRLEPLKASDIKKLLVRAVTDEEKGLGSFKPEVSEEVLDFLADVSEGDARIGLNAIELAVLSTDKSEDGKVHIDMQVAEDCIQRRNIKYEKDGDNHYDTISAFIKSMRGSDPDAAVYYLAKMLYAGESVTFIARRIMICAAEDVGLADPNAIVVATSCANAVEKVGMPEAQIILSEAAIYVATAPKSNACVNAIFAATDAVKTTNGAAVPMHLRDAHYSGAADLGNVGYKYAHLYKNHYVTQQYLPDALEGMTFYEPSDNGKEVEIKKWFEKLHDEAEE